MFRSRYASLNNQPNYIRQRYNPFNISSQSSLTSNERNLGNDNDITAVRNDDRTNIDIYNKDEEMTAFDIENEENEDGLEFDINNDDESSEDEVEFVINEESDYERVNDYERMMMEFNESDEEDSSDGEETSEADLAEDIIVDQPFGKEQMPHSFGEFAPYFKNITESLFFCWMQKHRICKFD
jgi:hypothetical protein